VSAQPLMEARHLDYAYPGGARAIRDVSLAVAPATLTAVIGSNGSGKSTLIRLLAGLLRPTSGEILLDGTALNAWQPRLRAREIAYMPQATMTVFPFRAIDVVLSGRTPHAPRFGFESDRDQAIAVEALEAAGAAHLAERSVTALSGGEKQMVILARALAQQPRVLLLDEPAAALDLKHRAELMRTLARLRDTRAISVVMITHDLQLTGSLFDRIVALHCGTLAAEGRPDEILQSALLADVYDDPKVRTARLGDQTMVWIDK
jgi:iron complex transport system ATP-binding protein